MSEPFSMRRRSVLLGVGGGLLLSRLSLGDTDHFEDALKQLEAKSGGRLGVSFWRPGESMTFGHRQDERFGLCSTFKMLLAGVILREAEAGRLELDARVEFSEEDLVPYAPVIEDHLEQGWMTIEALARATQVTSDNVAANLLLRLIGGPAGFTERLRAMGDDTTRLDRYEPEMNLVFPGEVHDTSTPGAMARSAALLFSDDTLSPAHRQKLADWMHATRTGRARLRAGLPKEGRIGNKTGTGIAEGMANKYNDVAVGFSVDNRPLFALAAYYEADGHYDRMRDRDQAVLARVGEIAVNASMGLLRKR